jgi:hypothetical protein
MKPLNSRAVSESLESYAGDLLAESTFFSALSAGEAHPGHVRDVFGQYCPAGTGSSPARCPGTTA